MGRIQKFNCFLWMGKIAKGANGRLIKGSFLVMGTKSIANGLSVDTWMRGKLEVPVYLREDHTPSESWGGAHFSKG